MRLILATNNDDKTREIRAIFRGLDISLINLNDFERQPDMRETGVTFKANAIQKAEAVANYYDMAALADDSGLEVDALGGEPGVYSARYSGPGADDNKNNQKLLRALSDIPPGRRGARFRTVAALITRRGRLVLTEGCLEGSIALAPAGTCGFGYDPLFIPKGTRVSVAELKAEEKNAISHRGRAFEEMKKILSRLKDELAEEF